MGTEVSSLVPTLRVGMLPRRSASITSSIRTPIWPTRPSMSSSLGWFIWLLSLAALGFAVGCALGRGPSYRRWGATILAVTGILLWSWLQQHPAITINAIPAGILRYLEGTAPVPVFMLVVGTMWSSSRHPRQRRTAVLAVVLASTYFLTGGLWMLQSTPRQGFAHTSAESRVLQSQEFSCVPAACATLLNEHGIRTTEAQMARLTETRPGTGATLVRAVDGLQQRLKQHAAGTPSAGAAWSVQVVEPRVEELRFYPMPFLTPLRLQAARHHMVVVLEWTPRHVRIFDPVDGLMLMNQGEFAEVYTSQVIIVTR